RTGRVLAPAGFAVGAVIPVWVDAAGRLVGPPAQPGPHDSRAPTVGMVAVLLLAELLWGAGLAARGVMDRRRLAAWDAEWRAIGPPGGGHPCPAGAPAARPPRRQRATRPEHKPRHQAGRSRATRAQGQLPDATARWAAGTHRTRQCGEAKASAGAHRVPRAGG